MRKLFPVLLIPMLALPVAPARPGQAQPAPKVNRPEVVLQLGHTDRVTGVAWSP
jgi:hypothetical protein